MVELFEEEWASFFGGELLYEEPEEETKAKRTLTILASCAFVVLGSILVVIPLTARPKEGIFPLVVAVMAIAFGFFLIALSIVALYDLKNLRPFRV